METGMNAVTWRKVHSYWLWNAPESKQSKTLNPYVLPSWSFRWALSLARAHRANTAFRAISRLRSDVSLAARILPPFDPPSFPNATALGFFFLPIVDVRID